MAVVLVTSPVSLPPQSGFAGPQEHNPLAEHFDALFHLVMGLRHVLERIELSQCRVDDPRMAPTTSKPRPTTIFSTRRQLAESAARSCLVVQVADHVTHW